MTGTTDFTEDGHALLRPRGTPTAQRTAALDGATTALVRDLIEIRSTAPRCGSCECFLTVAAQASMDLERVDSPVAIEARRLFGVWLDEAEGLVQVCNNCEVCVPAGPYQRFTAVASAWRGAQGDPS